MLQIAFLILTSFAGQGGWFPLKKCLQNWSGLCSASGRRGWPIVYCLTRRLVEIYYLFHQDIERYFKSVRNLFKERFVGQLLIDTQAALVRQ